MADAIEEGLRRVGVKNNKARTVATVATSAAGTASPITIGIRATSPIAIVEPQSLRLKPHQKLASRKCR
jgi:hypothetical protein